MYTSQKESMRRLNNVDWNSNINVLQQLSRSTTAKASTRTFKPFIHYRTNPQNYQPELSSHEEVNQRGTRRKTETEEDKSDIEAIKTVIEQMALKIKQLEEQQENSSACAIRRFNNLNNQMLKSSDTLHNKLKEDEIKTLKNELFAFKDSQRKEINEVQIALNYLNERMMGRLSDIEAATIRAAERNNTNVSSLNDSLKSFNYDTEHRFQSIEKKINETTSYKTDTLDSLLKIVQEQIEEIVGDMIKNGILEYARAKEGEDYRRFALVDQRMLELENDKGLLMKELEASKVDIRFAAKKGAAMEAKLKELEGSITSALAEVRSMNTMAEANQKAQRNMVKEYWEKMQREISSMQSMQDQEIAKFNSKIKESTESILAINEDITKLRNKVNESIDNLFEVTIAHKTNTRTELDDIKDKLETLSQLKGDNNGVAKYKRSNEEQDKKFLEEAKDLFKADIENIYMELGEIRIKLMKEEPINVKEEPVSVNNKKNSKEDINIAFEPYFDELIKDSYRDKGDEEQSKDNISEALYINDPNKNEVEVFTNQDNT